MRVHVSKICAHTTLHRTTCVREAAIEPVAGEDRTHDLRIMGPTRCQLRYSHLVCQCEGWNVGLTVGLMVKVGARLNANSDRHPHRGICQCTERCVCGPRARASQQQAPLSAPGAAGVCQREEHEEHHAARALTKIRVRHPARIGSISEVAQWLACWAHNPKVRGSKPRFATCRPAREC